MEPIKITIEGFGVKHELPPLDAELAAAWMEGRGIALTDAAVALEKAAFQIIQPIVAEGMTVLKRKAADALAVQETEILSAYVVAEEAPEPEPEI